jgi:hypothetical protein
MTFDITTLSDQAFYGPEGRNDRSERGYFSATINSTRKAATKVWLAVLDNTKRERDEKTPSWRRMEHFDDTPIADLQVGDLVAYKDLEKYRGSYPRRASNTEDVTVAEWVAGTYRPPTIARVIKKSAKMVTVAYYNNPTGWYGYDFGFLAEPEEWTTERWGQSDSRFVVRLGQADEVMAKIGASKEFARWERCRAAADAAVAEHNRRDQVIEDARKAEARAAKKAQEDAARPHRKVADTLNAALGFEVFTATPARVARAKGWGRVPVEALIFTLAGRQAGNYITPAAQTEAVALLRKHGETDGSEVV